MDLLHNDVEILIGNYTILERPYLKVALHLNFTEIHEGIKQISWAELALDVVRNGNLLLMGISSPQEA